MSLLLADVAWRPLGLHPAVLGTLLVLAGATLLGHALLSGATKSDRAAYFGVHPELYWGISLIVAGFGAFLALL